MDQTTIAYKTIIHWNTDNSVTVSIYRLKDGSPITPAALEGDFRNIDQAVHAVGMACLFGHESD